MTHPHDDDAPVEHDPTGMRALLGSLPDPGPMPADLVARIEAALADEARVRGGWPAPEAPAPVGAAADEVPGTVVPLRRRSRWHLVAVAASVVGVVGIGGVVVEAFRPGGLTASFEVDSGASSGAGGAADAPQLTDRGGRGLVAEDDELGVVVLESGRTYSAAGLADEVRDSLPWDGTGRDPAATPEAPQREGAADPGLGPLGTVAGARACADGLGVPADNTVVVDLATVEGAQAAVLVATDDAGARTAWAVQRSCREDAPGLVTGPVSVG